MKLLIIEDNDDKFDLIVRALKPLLTRLEITRVESYQSGVEEIVNSRFDLALLDMTLPEYDLHPNPIGIEFFTFGGELILREAKRRKIPTKFIVITQFGTFVRNGVELSFEDLKQTLTEKFPDSVIGCLKLDKSSDAWIIDLNSTLDESINN